MILVFKPLYTSSEINYLIFGKCKKYEISIYISSTLRCMDLIIASLQMPLAVWSRPQKFLDYRKKGNPGMGYEFTEEEKEFIKAVFKIPSPNYAVETRYEDEFERNLKKHGLLDPNHMTDTEKEAFGFYVD